LPDDELRRALWYDPPLDLGLDEDPELASQHRQNLAAAAKFLPAQFRGAGENAGGDLGLSVGYQATLAGQILTNNIQVSFVAFAGGILAGVGTTLVLLYNGALIGGVAGLTVEAGRMGPFLSLVAPHGVLELSVIAVSGAAGFTVGWALVDPGRRSRRVALGLGARRGAEIVLGTMPWFVVAGVVEGFVTPTSLPLAGAIAVGLLVAAPYWVLVFWRGRPEPAAEPAGGS
jgi:uncharacterized membrane protein SpoIIM required for sporulation